MAHISLKNVSVTYPIYDVSRAFKASTSDDTNTTGASITKQGRFGRNKVIALDNINLEFEAGERIGLIGKNGAGKSTLIRTIAGIYPPNEGTVDVEGVVSSMLNLGLGMQADATGRRNILLKGLVRGYSRKQIAELTPEIIEFSGLGSFIDLPMRTYSQGMAMRLTFAILTAFTPDILLLDEWIGAGDADFQMRVNQRMDSLLEQSGIVVLASHNLGLINKVCDRVLLMESGTITADYRRSDSQFSELIEEMLSKTRARSGPATKPLLKSGQLQDFALLNPLHSNDAGTWLPAEGSDVTIRNIDSVSSVKFTFTPYFPLASITGATDSNESEPEIQRVVRLSIGDLVLHEQTISNRDMDTVTSTFIVEIEISDEMVQNEVDMTIFISTIGSPADYGESNDERHLGIFLRNVTAVLKEANVS